MSGLSALKFTNSKRQQVNSPQHARRQKLCSKLDEQILLAKAEQSGTQFAPTKLRTVKDEVTGETRKVETPKKLKPWWWTGENGKLHIAVHYGARTLEIVEGMNAIEANSIAEVITSLQVVRSAVVSGQLDKPIEALTKEHSKSLSSLSKFPTAKRSILRIPSKTAS